MAILIFFGSAFLVIIVSSIYVVVSIRNLLRQRQQRLNEKKAACVSAGSL